MPFHQTSSVGTGHMENKPLAFSSWFTLDGLSSLRDVGWYEAQTAQLWLSPFVILLHAPQRGGVVCCGEFFSPPKCQIK